MSAIDCPTCGRVASAGLIDSTNARCAACLSIFEPQSDALPVAAFKKPSHSLDPDFDLIPKLVNRPAWQTPVLILVAIIAALLVFFLFGSSRVEIRQQVKVGEATPTAITEPSFPTEDAHPSAAPEPLVDPTPFARPVPPRW